MGGWSQADFGVSELPRTAIMFAGGNPLDLEERSSPCSITLSRSGMGSITPI